MAGKDSGSGLSKDEREALKARTKELREQEKAGKNREAGLKSVLAAIEQMDGDDRVIAEGLHQVVTEVAPELVPKTFYGMPGYANSDGKVLVFVQAAKKFKARYATIGFQDNAQLDDGELWATGYAVLSWSESVKERFSELVKKAVS